MNIEKWKGTYTIRSYEVDASNRARLSVLWDIMQDAASIHAGILGFDYHMLHQKGIFWMLCRMRLAVSRYPEMGEEITVLTVPSGVDKIFAIRDYEAYDSFGVLVAKGRSCWIIANMKTLKPERVKAHLPELDVTVSGEVPGKIKVSGNAISQKKVMAEYGDIDVNNHVNNGRYIHWIENAMDADGLYPHPKWIQVNFVAEEKKGAAVDIFRYENQNKFYFEMKNIQGKLVLQVEGE